MSTISIPADWWLVQPDDEDGFSQDSYRVVGLYDVDGRTYAMTVQDGLIINIRIDDTHRLRFKYSEWNEKWDRSGDSL